MTTRAWLIAILLFALPSLCHAQTTHHATAPSNWTGEVVRVVDGDTIVVRLDGVKETIRIIGIDTPETVDPRKPVQAFGREASAYTKKTLLGKSVRLEPDQGNAHIRHRDRYGRLLAYVWVSNVFFNEKIIREGYAHAYTKYPFRSDYMALFLQAEREAREMGRGLWGPR